MRKYRMAVLAVAAVIGLSCQRAGVVQAETWTDLEIQAAEESTKAEEKAETGIVRKELAFSEEFTVSFLPFTRERLYFTRIMGNMPMELWFVLMRGMAAKEASSTKPIVIRIKLLRLLAEAPKPGL